jgi:hypothetical protein
MNSKKFNLKWDFVDFSVRGEGEGGRGIHYIKSKDAKQIFGRI